MIVAALLACALTTVMAESMDIKKAVEEGLIGSYSEKPAEGVNEEDQEMQTGEVPKMRRDANDFGHRDVKVTAMIPDYLGKEIPVGDEVEMLVWFSNGAKTPLNVKGIFSALQSASDASKFIQNVCVQIPPFLSFIKLVRHVSFFCGWFSQFTPRVVDIVVEGKSEASISYKFRPSEYLTAMPYRFFSMIEYNDAKGQRYFNVLFNETLAFTEANVAFDVELIATYLLIIGFVVGMGYLAYTCFQKKTVCESHPPFSNTKTHYPSFLTFTLWTSATQGKGKGKKAAVQAAPAAPVPHAKNEWLMGTSAHDHMKREKKEKKERKSKN